MGGIVLERTSRAGALRVLVPMQSTQYMTKQAPFSLLRAHQLLSNQLKGGTTDMQLPGVLSLVHAEGQLARQRQGF